MINYNCDNQGNDCHYKREVRLVPLNKIDSSNVILCFNHYLDEINFRIERNKSLSKEAKFSLPEWNDLKIYDNN